MIQKFRPIAILVLVSFLWQSCANEEKTNPYLITKHQVGFLNDSTQVKDLKLVFKNDSISSFKNDSSFTGITTDVHILNKEGTRLLSLSPTDALDSTATIRTVKIEDPKFVTDKGVGLNSTFGQISAHYKINRIDNLIKTIVINVDELNATFAIDKEELPANMRFDMSLNIDPIQIPDAANIKYFMLHW
ncbi:MAG: hypothetical protein AAGH46_00430 [Bacteroidota bacterium]